MAVRQLTVSQPSQEGSRSLLAIFAPSSVANSDDGP
jgi:hypothetical protein